MMRTRILFAVCGATLCLATGCGQSDPFEHDAQAKASEAEGHSAPHWSYSGETGPSHWSDLSEEWQVAKNGTRQSPIDLRVKTTADVPDLRTSYRATVPDVVDNGHTIQVNHEKGSYLDLDNERYELLQFHFHSPSEHTIRGRSMPLECHLVHKNAAGELAVVGVMFETGDENDFLADLWPRVHAASDAKNDARINVGDLLPSNLKSYRYDGSLTTPPCSEGVSWIVLETPVPISKAQIAEFRKMYNGNNRPVQPLNDRSVRLGK